MRTFRITALAAAVSIAFLAAGCGSTQSESTRARNDIGATYRADEQACKPLAGNAHEVCIAEAKGRQSVALAEIEARNHPSDASRRTVRTARADAVFAVARERCDDYAGNAYEVCVKQAESEHVAANADALLDEKTAEANAAARRATADAEARQRAANAEAEAIASESTAAANATAQSETADAMQVATDDKRKAELKLAEQKCEVFAGSVKDNCLREAEARHGQR